MIIDDFHAHLYPRPFMDEIARVGGPHGIALSRGQDGLERLRFAG